MDFVDGLVLILGRQLQEAIVYIHFSAFDVEGQRARPGRVVGRDVGFSANDRIGIPEIIAIRLGYDRKVAGLGLWGGR
jgi:hypothetical protein